MENFGFTVIEKFKMWNIDKQGGTLSDSGAVYVHYPTLNPKSNTSQLDCDDSEIPGFD
jgi:hypothetical protein